MRFAGFDIGSRTLKLVILENDRVIEKKLMPNKYDFDKQVNEMLTDCEYDYLVATGYGRHYFDDWEKTETISEIKAFSAGVNWHYPGELTILDIGGQDTKAISLDKNGRMKKFVMNDKCAAGTGRFLEIMAAALNLDIGEFGSTALLAEKAEKINSMCTVFAESEVISSLSRGADPKEVALGIHNSIVDRAIGLINKVKAGDRLVFAGGVSRNPAVAEQLEQKLGVELIIPENGQLLGAWGSAVLAKQKWEKKNDIS